MPSQHGLPYPDPDEYNPSTSQKPRGVGKWRAGLPLGRKAVYVAALCVGMASQALFHWVPL